MNEIASEMMRHMKQQVENPAQRDSKFVFDGVVHMDIDFHRLNLMRGSSYLPLPEWPAKKGAIINSKNDDMECFKWAVIAATKWKDIGDHPEKITKLKKYEDNFDWANVKFPVSFRDINRFGSRNEIMINVLSYENKKYTFIEREKNMYLEELEKCPELQTANLMIVTVHNKRHYIAIKSLSRLLSRQNNKHKESQHFFINCPQGFKKVQSRDQNLAYCRNNEAVKVEMPKKKSIVKYSDGQYQFKVPFMMHADFESILAPIEGASNNPNVSSTRVVNVHEPSGWCVYSHISYGNIANPLTQYRGVDCVNKF